jgi:uncharacterized protein YndB with AHSA1/START domain
MSEPTVVHNTLTLERAYSAPVARVFAAWAEPAAKARWFAGEDVEHELDFRVGGREVAHRPAGDGLPDMRFESFYRDIVPERRIVYVSTLYADGHPATVSLTSVQFHADGQHTQLELTEHGAFLDGREQPGWRERGTNAQLDALGRALEGDPQPLRPDELRGATDERGVPPRSNPATP